MAQLLNKTTENEGFQFTETFAADDDELDRATDFVSEKLEEAGVGPKLIMQTSVCLEEIFVNVAHYAYPNSNGKVEISVGCDGSSFKIRFVDSGIPFDPLAKEDPDITLEAQDRKIGGLGIYMVKNMMDDVTYENKDGKNILTVFKTI